MFVYFIKFLKLDSKNKKQNTNYGNNYILIILQATQIFIMLRYIVPKSSSLPASLSQAIVFITLCGYMAYVYCLSCCLSSALYFAFHLLPSQGCLPPHYILFASNCVKTNNAQYQSFLFLPLMISNSLLFSPTRFPQVSLSFQEILSRQILLRHTVN